jgi:hypothetical protein
LCPILALPRRAGGVARKTATLLCSTPPHRVTRRGNLEVPPASSFPWRQEKKTMRAKPILPALLLLSLGIPAAVAFGDDPRASAPAAAAAAAAAKEARELQQAGRPREAVELRKRAIALYEAADGPAADVELARLHTDQGRVLDALEEYGESERHLRRALELRESLHGEGHHAALEVARSLAAVVRKERPDDPDAEALLLRRLGFEESWSSHRDLGLYYKDRGRLDLAAEHLVHAERLAEEDVRTGIWRLPTTLGELAEVYRDSGSHALAETAMLRSLEARERQLGARHPQLASTLRDIGAYYVEQERWSEAESYLQRALDLKENAYGSCDACNRDVVELLATVYEAQGRAIDFCAGDAEATDAIPIVAVEERREKALETERRDDDGRAAAAALENEDDAVDAMIRRGELALALATADDARARRVADHGESSLEVARSLAREARAAGRMKRYDLELELREQRLAILEERLGPDHVAVAAELEHLARAAQREGQESRGIAYLERAVALREQAGQTMMLAGATTRLAELERDLGDPRAAANRFLLATDLWEQAAGADAREYVEASIDLADGYRALGLADEAEALLSDLLEREEQRETLRFSIRLRLLEALERLYDGSGREEAAADIERRLTALRALPRSR